MDPFLGKVADPVVLWFGDFAGVGFQDTSYAFHEGGFTGSIVSSESDALLFSNREGEVFEDHTGSEFHAEVFDSEHVGGLVESGEI